ncbi:hypothetical protein QBC35DRAFT_30493 [Podospora australis]|uniref:Uncharacterized protein n=1 Tax=Podospora australis TaxID=1536484 RepID=A0AAN6WRI4_9PEZI|nr:hypothetical protein QBC35DRAFT_30493 [Podospora australis]
MVRASTLLTSATLAAVSAAQQAATTSVTSLIMPMLGDDQTIWASVMSAGPDATQYFIACSPDMDDTECGLANGFTVVNGPSTLSVSMAMVTVTAAFSCKLDGRNAVCTGSTTDVEEKTLDIMSETMSNYSQFAYPVTITAGLEKLAAATGGSVAPSTTGTGTGAAAPTGTSGGEGAGSGTSSSTAGVPRITGNAVVMGAAALVGGAAMLL